MPSRSQIKDYWFPLHFSKFGETRTGDDELVDDECWACGSNLYIERCHIHSFSEGGSNNTDNLVLLCRGCHHESELLSPQFFWNWIRGKRQTDWMSQIERACKKIELVFGSMDNLVNRVSAVGAEKAINEVFNGFGFEKTSKDLARLYSEIEKNMDAMRDKIKEKSCDV